MEFHPSNPIVKHCIQGMAMNEQGMHEEAGSLFIQAWNEARHDFEKFLAAYFVAKNENNASGKLKWFETSLEYALKINDETVSSALPSLYTKIAECHEELGDQGEAERNHNLAKQHNEKPSEEGPFFHGTRADLKIGDLLKPGGTSNYEAGLRMNHVYFTAMASGAGLAASLAKGDGRERVYMVEPTGPFENDPNVTDKKFPGNLTRSYRSEAPLKIVGEIVDWTKQTQEELQQFRNKLENNKGEIIN